MVALEDSEYKKVLNECLISIDNGRTKENIKLIFNLHNMRLKQNKWSRETGLHCGGCITRVINKMRKYNTELNG